MKRDPGVASPRLKTLIVLALAILANGAGDLSLSHGARLEGPSEARMPSDLGTGVVIVSIGLALISAS